ncbi:biotin synthase BioB [Lentisphaerota bacterium ZTH]|nr:biotin synthase BioB [Lentisphaerota bacterium]WET06339.1 biotin synthase BioB [Lentisphaerota bacterium ZTH]
MLNRHIKNAYKVLEGKELTHEEAVALINEVDGNDLLDLVSLANKVRDKFAPGIFSCSILNAKSGVCSQNCRFCAQSSHHNTGVDTYGLVTKKEAVEAAQAVYDNGVRSFGYVTSGHGYTEPNEEFLYILETLDELRERFPDMKLCVSIGILSRKTAEMLAQHHTGRYNMNLQTAPAKYAELIADTHSIEEKIQTIKWLQEFGVEICCGGIFGLGEAPADRVDMAFAIKELDVDGIPLNLLLPIKGTPLENVPTIEPAEAVKAFALCRLINPTKMIKFAAGRETTMKDYQALLMLSGINALMTGGYLTTRGRSVDEDKAFVRSLDKFSSKN